jgi:hypothetical protein
MTETSRVRARHKPMRSTPEIEARPDPAELDHAVALLNRTGVRVMRLAFRAGTSCARVARCLTTLRARVRGVAN